MPSSNRMRLLSKIAFVWTACVSVVESTGVTPYLPQSFFFDWNKPGQPVPIPTTEQCEPIHITFARSTALGPNNIAPYYLQVYTSTSIVPIIIPAGNGLTFDWPVPFAPGTQYQICMFDKNGNTGGCQATYTVIPPSKPPTCNNVTYPPLLAVDAQVNNGPMSQYGWVDQCSDISITPKNGTAPYTLTVAPALHPPYNISSPDTKPINWTVSLNWASPFFISLVDADGNMWANGPLHAGGGGTTGCLAGNVTQAESDTVKPVVAIGAGVGGLAVGLLIGILGAFLLLRSQYKKKLEAGRFAEPAGPGSPQPLMYEEGGQHPHYRPVPTASSSGVLTNTLSMASHPPSMSHRLGQNSMGYQVEPFTMPDDTNTIYGQEPRSPGSGYAPSLSNRVSTVAHASTMAHEPTHTRPPMPASQSGSSNQVYVVHHDSQTAPVTIYHGDGTRVVELPPSYPPMSSAQSDALSEGRSGSDGRSDGSRMDSGPGRLVLHQERQPGLIGKPVRGP